MACIVQVAVSNIVEKIDRPYDYYYPFEEQSNLVGRRVLVPFGKANKLRKGLILTVREDSEGQNLKTVAEVLDATPVLNEHRIALLEFLKEHYFISYYASLKCLLPPAFDIKIKRKYLYTGAAYESRFEPLVAYFKTISSPKSMKELPLELQTLAKQATDAGVLSEMVTTGRTLGDLSEKMITLSVSADRAQQYMCSLPQRSQGQRDVLAILLDSPHLSVKEAVYMTGCGVSSLKTLEKNGLIRLYYQPVARIPYKNMVKKSDDSEITLNDQQLTVYQEIAHSLSDGTQTHLLYGVTGSGKTLVYMKLIQKVLAMGKSVLFLVPEISLTPQTLQTFYSRFGERVSVIHSGLSMGERADEWKKIQTAEQSIVVGTRSAVFAPIRNLGLIILDEEHEASYKSEMSPKFHARDIARFLSAQYKIPLLLGSATPSIESFRSARIGKYRLHTLKSRFNNIPLPDVETVDMRTEYKSGNMSFLSQTLKEKIEQTVNADQQIILFLNRRGARTLVACPACGYALKCPNCDISMTYHSANQRCICHFCSYSIKVLDKCPKCGSPHIKMTGLGTQRVETELREIFPDTSILRMDMDTVSGYADFQRMMDDFANGKYQILLGTQMIAKGLNFPNVTLVGVLAADQSLYIEDFRAGERTFSLLTQVCGRSGRSKDTGRAVVQTFCPEHEVLRFAEQQDYISFYEYEISFRKAVCYPPFCDLALFTVTAATLQTAEAAAGLLFEKIEQHAETDAADLPIRLLRPTVPRIARVAGRYRVQLIVKCRNNARFRAIIRLCMNETEEAQRVKIGVDINPLSFL